MAKEIHVYGNVKIVIPPSAEETTVIVKQVFDPRELITCA
jgi:hypothetical protein